MKKSFSTLLGVILGLVLGVPLSYYVQPDVVQMKLSLPEYLGRLPGMFESADPDYILPFILTCVLCALIFGVGGYFVGQAGGGTERSSD